MCQVLICLNCKDRFISILILKRVLYLRTKPLYLFADGPCDDEFGWRIEIEAVVFSRRYGRICVLPVGEESMGVR